MNTMMLILLALAATAAVVWTTQRFARLIADDGYGHRPAPRSHYDEERRNDPVLAR